MKFKFANRKLELLYTVGKGVEKLPPEVVTAFFLVIELMKFKMNALYMKTKAYTLRNLLETAKVSLAFA